MATLPGFTDVLRKQYKPLLEQSREHLLKAVDWARSESLCTEFDMSIADAYRALSETCYLLSEYRVNVTTYKYAPYDKEDAERKEKKAAERDGGEEDQAKAEETGLDEWERNKINKENLSIANFKKQSLHYLK